MSRPDECMHVGEDVSQTAANSMSLPDLFHCQPDIEIEQGRG